MFKPSSPTPVSGRSMAALFGSRSLAFLCSVIVVLLGFLASAAAQDKEKPADSQAGASVAAGQTSAGDQSQAQTAPVVDAGPAQRLVHIVPFDRGASPVKNTFAPAGAHLTYFGGPVISNVHIVIVFWGTNVDPVVTTPGTIDQFFADITSSRYYDLLSEYSTVGVTGAGPSATSSNQTIGRGQFDATVTIIPASTNCPGGTATCTLTDNQIQAELTNQLAAGHLPPPVKDAHGIIETFYMIYFPPGVHINLGTAPSCAQGGFCAYHSNTSALVPYGVLPDFGPVSGCQAPHCGNGTEFQNITAVTSHEMSEAVTDAQVGSASVFDAPLAWYDHVPSPGTDLGEIGDICGGQDTTVSAGGKTYTVQTEFSNLQNDCVSAPPVFNLSAPAAVAQGISTNITLTIQSSLTGGTLAGYLGTVHFTSSDAPAILPADYTFTAADAGTHTFPFTMKTLGSQNITVTDVHSAGFTGSVTFNVANGPDLVISKTHTGNFAVGQTGATYAITVSNIGTAASGAGVTVTVTDTLPAGLNATAFAGTGWSCSALPALSCTRSDSLAAGASYPSLTLTVDVTAASPTTVTNSAAVSGGNDSNTNNNTALDQTIIGPRLPSDLSISSFHGSSFIQGQTGTYTISVGNAGPGATFGQVTVTDTLPTGMTGASISGTGWSCSAPTAVPLTCTRSDALPATISFPQITVTVNVAANATSPLTNTVSISGGNDGNLSNNTATDSTIIIINGVDLQIAPISSGSIFSQGQTGAQAFFVVSNQGSATSSGTVTATAALSAGLTATAISGPGWSCTLATLTCTRADALAVAMGFSAITVTFDVAKTAPSTGSITMSVSGGNDANTANNTGSFGVFVSPAIGIAPQGPSTATVNAGTSASYNLSLTLGPGAGTVTFSCSGLPTGAACSFNPPSLTASGTEVVTISTTSRVASTPLSLRRPYLGPPQLLLLALAVSFFMLLAWSNRSARRAFALGAASLVLLWVIGGCGGGGGSTGGPTPTPTPTPIPTPTPNPNGTPVGTFAIVVTASGSSSPAAASLTLVVK